MSLETDATDVSASLSLLEEQLSIVLRRIEGDTVRVSTVTKTTEEQVAEEISHERGRHIDIAPLVREEEEVTIIPIIEEVLIVDERLFLREECIYVASAFLSVIGKR
jgi:hypothetical protein